MTNKHTPAPWSFVESARGLFQVSSSSRSDVIVSCGYREEDKANAQLIAAAPELFVALKRHHTFQLATDDFYKDSELYQISHAAITKVEQN